MTTLYIFSGCTLAFMFILFLVLANSINNIINLILKIEYLLLREVEYRKEEKEIARVLTEKTDQENQ